MFFWKFSSSGQLTLRAAWHAIRSCSNPIQWSPFVWSSILQTSTACWLGDCCTRNYLQLNGHNPQEFIWPPGMLFALNIQNQFNPFFQCLSLLKLGVGLSPCPMANSSMAFPLSAATLWSRQGIEASVLVSLFNIWKARNSQPFNGTHVSIISTRRSLKDMFLSLSRMNKLSKGQCQKRSSSISHYLSPLLSI